jgi:hypothetical protein
MFFLQTRWQQLQCKGISSFQTRCKTLQQRQVKKWEGHSKQKILCIRQRLSNITVTMLWLPSLVRGFNGNTARLGCFEAGLNWPSKVGLLEIELD